MLGLFNRQPVLLDETIIQWIMDTFQWALLEFNYQYFQQQTRLVYPDNQHFPGAGNTVNEKANLIFDRVKYYAGMEHWPTELIDLSQNLSTRYQSITPNPPSVLRGKQFDEREQTPSSEKQNKPIARVAKQSTEQGEYDISFSYTGGYEAHPNQSTAFTFQFYPQQLAFPDAFIAHLAQGLGVYLAQNGKMPPPGGADYLPMAGELVGIVMGFGIMFANSAVVQRAGGCGGCGGAQQPARNVILSEEESTYALALFCYLKSIKPQKVTRLLKKHLRKFFKQSLKDVARRLDEAPLLLTR